MVTHLESDLEQCSQRTVARCLQGGNRSQQAASVSVLWRGKYLRTRALLNNFSAPKDGHTLRNARHDGEIV